MIVKFFTHGTGGSNGVFDYLLKDKDQEDGLRRDAEVLSGDIDNQALLIDSLDFKQKYTSGCLSFTESAEQVTQEQKKQLMDGFEETIRAGLDIDRVAVSWVEHRDKGRLELNFVFANVDLKHGRAFQPYVHSQDKRRVNAWKDIQNIKHGFTDPNDPINKRLLGQRDNLPRVIKEVRQVINDALQDLVAIGVITSRDDVIQTLKDEGFEVVRETDKAISIKNPDPKATKNIRLTGELYERDFKFSAEFQEKITTASDEYRAGATERYESAKQLYAREIERKREYHKGRHGEPKHDKQAVKTGAKNPSRRYSYSNYSSYRDSPTPYQQGFSRNRKKQSDNDAELRRSYHANDREERERNREEAKIRVQNVGMVGVRNSLGYIGSRHSVGWVDGQQILKTELRHSKITDTAADNLRVEVRDGQATARPSAEGAKSARGHDRAAESDVRRQRTRYSRINRLIDQVSIGANARDQTLTDINAAVAGQDRRTSERTEWLAQASTDLHELDKTASRRVSEAMQSTNSAHSTHERVSECASTARDSKHDYDVIKEQINRMYGSSGETRDITENNDQIADRNRSGVNDVRQAIEQLTEVIMAQDNQHQQRYSAPKMGR